MIQKQFKTTTKTIKELKNEIKTIKVDLINSCNIACNFCPYHGNYGNITTNLLNRTEKKSQIDLEKLIEFLDNFNTQNNKIDLHFSGRGESLLYPKFDTLIEKTYSMGFNNSLITNGILIDKHKEQIENYIKKIVVSIHSNQKEHDKIVGKNGAYNTAIKNLINLNKNNNNNNNTLEKITLAYVITPSNLDYMNEYAKFATDNGFEFRFHHDFNPLINSTNWNDKNLRKLKENIKIIEENYKKSKIIPKLNSKQINSYYTEKIFIKNPHYCDKYNSSIEIISNGNIVSCRNNELSNLYNHSFEEIIMGNKRVKFLDETKYNLENKGLKYKQCDRCCYQ